MQERIYISKKTGKCYGEIEIDGNVQIDITNHIERDMKNFKKVGENNSFTIYDKKKSK